MAKRRMFSIALLGSARFMQLHRDAQLLYVRLNLVADDDGIVDNALIVMKGAGIAKKHLQQLLEEGYLIELSKNILAITHWFANNKIQKDRYTPTSYIKEREALSLVNGVYERVKESGKEQESSDFFGYKMDPQVSIGKEREGKESLEKVSQVELSLVKESKSAGSADSSDGEAPSDCNAQIGEISNLEIMEMMTREAEERKQKELSDIALEAKSSIVEPSFDRELTDPKPYKELLSEGERISYNKFLIKLKLYAMGKYKGFDVDRFIEYNEGRHWRGKDGENVMGEFENYLHDWYVQKIQPRVSTKRV